MNSYPSIFSVVEYLPPPKILICTKCHTPEHVEKECQSNIDICRRCGNDKNSGSDHIECSLNVVTAVMNIQQLI